MTKQEGARDEPDDDAIDRVDEELSSQGDPGPAEPSETRPEPATPIPLDEESEEVVGDPESLQARLEEAESELAALREEQEEVKQRWLRARADYDNLVRRTAKEREDQKRNAAARLIGDLLPPLEILERAAQELAEVDDAHAKGIRLALGEMKSTLAREGLEEVPGEGHAFDANQHEAVAREPADAPEGTVVEVVRPGYTLHGRLLRAALVKVSSGPGEESGSS